MESKEQTFRRGADDRFRRLIEIGGNLLAELNLEAVLSSVVDAAREVTGARYAALGDLPRGRGGRGEHSFLGVPITVGGETYGNLYMTAKQGAEEFDETDEEVALTLAGWAGIAIENARTVGGETNVARVLDLIVKRARALVDARALLVLLRRGDHLFVAARAGTVGEEVEALTIPIDDPALGLREQLGAAATLVVPLLFRGRSVGALVALDREAGGVEFDQEDLRLLQSFAASAATAVATAQTVESERLRQQVESAERERERWARELHDEALQGLAAVRITLATALQSSGDRRTARIESAAEEAMVQLEGQINELNRLINDLRPAALERLGLPGAIEALARESSARSGIEIGTEVKLGEVPSRDEERIVYRLVQEALTNVVKHARASHVDLVAREGEGRIRISVCDDGEGFDPDAPGAGRGLKGMRERIELFGGELEVSSAPGEGTEISASVPLGQL